MLIIADWIEYGKMLISFTKMGLKVMSDTIFDIET